MQELSEAINTLVQHYRHDFLNVLQVVGGLAQLQKPEKLLAYIHRASEDVQQFGRFIGCGDARLALIVFNNLLQCFAGCYVLRVEGTVPLLADVTLSGLTQTLLAVRNCLQGLVDFSLHIYIEGGKQTILHLRLITDEAVVWQPVFLAAKQNGLRAVFDAKNSEFSLRLG